MDKSVNVQFYTFIKGFGSLSLLLVRLCEISTNIIPYSEGGGNHRESSRYYTSITTICVDDDLLFSHIDWKMYLHSSQCS
jgi:hypothetical protein